MVFGRESVKDRADRTSCQNGLFAKKRRGFTEPDRHRTHQGREGPAGEARERVRFDDERRNALKGRFEHRRARNVAARADHRLRLKFSQHHRRFDRASRQDQEILDAPPAADAFQALSVDRMQDVARRRDQPGFEASGCSQKLDFEFGPATRFGALAQLLGDGQRGIDVPAGAPRHHQDPRRLPADCRFPNADFRLGLTSPYERLPNPDYWFRLPALVHPQDACCEIFSKIPMAARFITSELPP